MFKKPLKRFAGIGALAAATLLPHTAKAQDLWKAKELPTLDAKPLEWSLLLGDRAHHFFGLHNQALYQCPGPSTGLAYSPGSPTLIESDTYTCTYNVPGSGVSDTNATICAKIDATFYDPSNPTQPVGYGGGYSCPFYNIPKYNERDNQVVIFQATNGRTLYGAGRYKNSEGNPTELVYGGREVYKHDFGRFQMNAAWIAGLTVRYKKGGSAPGVQIWPGSKTLLSPLVGVVFGAQLRISQHVSAGAKYFITPAFAAPLVETKYSTQQQENPAPTATIDFHW